MRFDDRLDTILSINPDIASGRFAMWRQLVDMLAQTGRDMPDALASRCLTILARLQPEVEPAAQITAIESLGPRLGYPPLVALFCKGPTPVVRAAMATAQMADSEWLALLPDCGPLGRSILRQRHDLSGALARGLASFGTQDFALPKPAPAQDAPSDIAALVRRIDDYRARRTTGEGADHGAVSSVQIRIDTDGLVRHVEGGYRAQFVGISLNEPADAGDFGCDAGVARAFGKRAPIRMGRLALPSVAEGQGIWQLDADPIFESATGRFAGYRGQIQPLEPQNAAAPVEADAPVADSMRQLVHELRSPLNAISGFAQLIHGQFFGAVDVPYRDLSARIMQDATLLTAALEDIDLAARLDMGRVQLESGASLCDDALHAAISAEAARRLPDGLPVQLTHSRANISLAVGDATLEMLLPRMIRATLAAPGASGLAVDVAILDDAAKITMHPLTGELAQGPAKADGYQLSGELTDRILSKLAILAGGHFEQVGVQCILTLPLLGAVHERFGAQRN
ncbi:MAG: hypothetical protein IT553_06900 [Sphingomonadaceae bacterium]|nr:hypothetical protein [Sphingomonadaceae bacterium]